MRHIIDRSFVGFKYMSIALVVSGLIIYLITGQWLIILTGIGSGIGGSFLSGLVIAIYLVRKIRKMASERNVTFEEMAYAKYVLGWQDKWIMTNNTFHYELSQQLGRRS